MGADVFYRTVLGPAKKSDSVAARPKAPQAMFTLTRGQSSTQNHLTRTTKTWGYVRVQTPTSKPTNMTTLGLHPNLRSIRLCRLPQGLPHAGNHAVAHRQFVCNIDQAKMPRHIRGGASERIRRVAIRTARQQ